MPAGHSRRVSESSCAIARSLNLAAEELEAIRIGALLHDIPRGRSFARSAGSWPTCGKARRPACCPNSAGRPRRFRRFAS
ncbi:MAG: HD domain-containing protein [Acidobacteria bacterium]|nr:HD domain-containing protein [Acidobacteriota bacterium]